MRTLNYINANAEELSNAKGWASRHRSAVHRGLTQTQSVQSMEFEHAVAQGVNAWVAYALCHKARYQSDIGNDYVLGQHWKEWGLGLRGLLNGESGDLDCGTLDSIIVTNLHEQFPEITF